MIKSIVSIIFVAACTDGGAVVCVCGCVCVCVCNSDCMLCVKFFVKSLSGICRLLWQSVLLKECDAIQQYAISQMAEVVVEIYSVDGI